MINLTNHPSSKWSKKQLEAACAVKDLPFPNIPPTATQEEVAGLALSFYDKAVGLLVSDNHLLLAGELSFCIAFIRLNAVRNEFVIITTTSERKVVETQLPDGTTKKDVVFEFVQFRHL